MVERFIKRPNFVGQPAGISLLEVLFSIFVLAVGLLSLAAMVPVGKFQVTNARNFDNFSVIGRAAMNEIEARDLYHIDDWATLNASNGTCTTVIHQAAGSDRFLFDPVNSVLNGAPPSKMSVPSGFSVRPTTPFALDPLFIAKNWSTAATESQWFAAGSTLFPMAIPRLTLGPDAQLPSGLTLAQRHALRERLAERIFVWQDDPVFDLTADDDARPKLINPTQPRINQIAGDYSFLVTVSPADTEDFMPATQRRWYTMSTVVFYKRNLVRDTSLPALSSEHPERLMTAQFPTGGGLGGGDVRLTLAAAPDADYFKVRKNQWILLIGRRPLPSPPYPSSPVEARSQQVAQWYRVVSVAQDDDPTGREVTLQGPDWTTDMDSDGTPDPRYAAVYDGVIGVYEKNIVLDVH